jgi:uncharacterized protein (TIGR03435 family)
MSSGNSARKRIRVGLPFAKKAALLVASFAGSAAICVLIDPPIQAQQQTQSTPAVASQKFEVAAIRRCAPDEKLTGAGITWSPGRMTMPCASLEQILNWVYSSLANGPHFDFRSSVPIEKAPAWLDSNRYAINVKAESPTSMVNMLTGPMMQTLLAERFKLRFHREFRDAPVYLLTLEKGVVPKLQPAQEGGCVYGDNPWDHPVPSYEQGKPRPRPCGWSEGGDVLGTTMKEFCALFKNTLDRPIIDKTGIEGVFDIHLDVRWPAPINIDGGENALADPADRFVDRFYALKTALKKIGLKLDAGRGPLEVIVLDHAEQPSEN